MSTVVKEKTKIFEAVLSSPGMADPCKITMRMSRLHIIALVRLVENGLSGKTETPDELVTFLTKDSRTELEKALQDILEKTGLSEFYNHLKTLCV